MCKVLILMSTYNGAKFLSMQLDSIINQKTTAEIELYVRDDGSTDNTVDILERYSNKIEVRFADSSGRTNMGPANSFWYLLMTSPRADYYFFADQDDLWDSDKIETAVQKIELYRKGCSSAEKTPLLYCCNGRTIDKDGNIISSGVRTDPPRFNIVSHIITGEVPGCSMAINSSLCDLLKEKDVGKILMHDWTCMAYAILEGNVVYDEKIHYSRRVHDRNAIAYLGKNKICRYMDAAKRWNDNRGTIRKFVGKLLEEESDKLKPEELVYLRKLNETKNSIRARFFIIFSTLTRHDNKAAVKSFKIRTFLGLI